MDDSYLLWAFFTVYAFHPSNRFRSTYKNVAQWVGRLIAKKPSGGSNPAIESSEDTLRGPKSSVAKFLVPDWGI
jgi:hypothetical protein